MNDVLDFFRNRIPRAIAQLPFFGSAFSLVWQAARKWTVMWGSLLIVQGVLPLATVFLTKEVVDGVADVLKRGFDSQSSKRILFLVAALIAVQLLAETLRALQSWIRTMQSELVQDHINAIIHDKSISVDLAFYEIPDFFDHLHRARMGASTRPIALLENLGSLIQNTITLFVMMAVLFRFGPLLPVALLVSTLPALFVVLRYTIRNHQWYRKNTENERRCWYFSWMLTSRQTAAELRLYQLGNFFNHQYQKLRTQLRSERLNLLKEQSRADLIAGASGYLISGGALAWTLWKTVTGQISFGDLALFYQAFHQGQRLMRSLLENVGQVYTNSLFLGNLFEFLKLEPRVVGPAQPLRTPGLLKEGIRFQNVAFRYPGSDRFALTEFDLEIPASQVVAIVGPNGAGKSTLIKLICRLYDPDSGRITFDGLDVRSFDVEELRKMIAVLFQDPVHYNSTAGENIAFGNLTRSGDQKSIVEACQLAGAQEIIERLPGTYETLLGNEFFGGTELSKGEWQRISLARAFFRDAPIILLDEPTSAMDAWAEIDWMKRFRQLAKGKTAVVITHRFTTAMRADLIYVMMSGRIVESGTHEQLLALGGLYAESCKEQLVMPPGI